MDQHLSSISDLIDLWRNTPTGLQRGAVRSLSDDLGIPVGSVRAMKKRGSIAKKHWPKLMAAARRHAETSSHALLFAQVSAEVLLHLSFASASEESKTPSPGAGESMARIAA